LRAAIAEVMWEHVSAPRLARHCDALGMPIGPESGDPWASKRNYVKDRLLGLSDEELEQIARKVAAEYSAGELLAMFAPAGVRGVSGELRNLIFAADGPKPRIVLRDAINNVIEIVDGADRCLIYDRPLGSAGLTWGELVRWWSETTPTSAITPTATLLERLWASVESPPERTLFGAYCDRYLQPRADELPALIPQVYLHYDPYTMRALARAGDGQALARQRMDFLMLLGDHACVVIEVDGKQHYADGNYASPRLYAEMVSEDRRLRLAGYEIYRFGGAELSPEDPFARTRVNDFFDALLARHGSA
jgi:hypothetical protein